MKPNLAKEPEDEKAITYPKYASPKLDGYRGLTQSGTVNTRSLKEIENIAVRQKFQAYQGLDGEFLVGSPTDPDVFSKTTSKLRTVHGDAEDVCYYVFDTLDLTKPYSERYTDLLALPVMTDVVILPQTIINSHVELEAFYMQCLGLGYEGVILRNPTAMYKEGRSTAKSQDMLKMKPFADAEFTVTTMFEAMENNNEEFTNELGRTARSSHQGNKTPKGMIGGFDAVWTNGMPFKIAAGTLSHDDRIDAHLNPAKYVGRIGVYRYMPYGLVDVPRHGRFKAWRDPNDL